MAIYTYSRVTRAWYANSENRAHSLGCHRWTVASTFHSAGLADWSRTWFEQRGAPARSVLPAGLSKLKPHCPGHMTLPCRFLFFTGNRVSIDFYMGVKMVSSIPWCYEVFWWRKPYIFRILKFEKYKNIRKLTSAISLCRATFNILCISVRSFFYAYHIYTCHIYIYILKMCIYIYKRLKC